MDNTTLQDFLEKVKSEYKFGTNEYHLTIFQLYTEAADRYASYCENRGYKRGKEDGAATAVSGSLPNKRKKYMRYKANTIFELTKGFTGEPTNSAMKAALEMAGHVLELTTDVELDTHGLPPTP